MKQKHTSKRKANRISAFCKPYGCSASARRRMLRDHLQPKPHHHHPGEQIRRIQTIRLDKYNGLRIATTIKVIEHVQGSFDRKKKKVSPAYKRSRSNKR